MAAVQTVRRAHPVHGILSAYPLAFFTGALATDIIYANSTQIMWANFSVWLITGGLLMGAVASVAGIVDWLAHRGRPRPARTGSALHTILTLAMLGVALVNAFIHSRDARTSVVPTGLILSVVTSVLAVASSWQGFVLLAREVR